MTPILQDKLRRLPDLPGVYLFRNEQGQVIYVGKAVSLRNRVRSYFHAASGQSPKVRLLVSHIADLEHIVTDSEVEALILESNLIKQHRPRYNVRLRDDKQYPYLRVSVQDEWPRVSLVRTTRPDGARYFGPFTSSDALRETLRLLRRVFPYRTCSDRRLYRGGRPCLYYDIHRCLAPCDARVGQAEYRAMIDEFIQFFAGRRAELPQRLRQRMQEAADRLDFEKAAELRDQLRAIEHVLHRQKIVTDSRHDRDVVGLAQDGERACVQVFYVREGKVIGRDDFPLAAAGGEEAADIMAAFLSQYYADAPAIPPEIVVSVLPRAAEAMTAWLSERHGARVRLVRPQRGEKLRLLRLVEENARLVLEQEARAEEDDRERAEAALADLQKALDLPRLPWRIECFDVSNLQGSQIVASLVVFEGGKARRSAYRRYRIRSVNLGRPDDFASMREVVYRRFRRGLSEREEQERASQIAERVGRKPRAGALATFPDLLLIDGGKGQLAAAREVLRLLGLQDIPTFGLAKRNEWLFTEGRAEPLVLERRAPALQLLQRVRDEAHRFAVTYHRSLRSRSGIRSLLEEAPGIGPKRRRALLRAFPSLAEMRRADVDALAAVPGMTRQAAEELQRFLAESLHPADLEA